MAEMNINTAELLQQMIDIKKDTRAAIERKGVSVFGGMITYPEAISRIDQSVINGAEIDFTRAGWTSENSDQVNVQESQYINNELSYTEQMDLNYRDYLNWPSIVIPEGFSPLISGVCKQRPPGWTNMTISPMIDNFGMSYPLYNGNTMTGGLFSGCYKLRYVPTFSLGDVTTMNNYFGNCVSLNNAPYLGTRKITNMEHLFYQCSSLVNIPLYNTQNVTNLKQAFYHCDNLISIPELNTQNVVNMYETFAYCRRLVTIPKLNANKLKIAPHIFYACESLTDFGGFENLKISLTIDVVVGTRWTNLSKQSVVNIINNLYDWSSNPDNLIQSEWGSNPTITGALRVDLTEDEIVIATNKGWTLT